MAERPASVHNVNICVDPGRVLVRHKLIELRVRTVNTFLFLKMLAMWKKVLVTCFGNIDQIE